MFASLAKSLKCGEWAYLFATNVANEKILLDIAVLDHAFWVEVEIPES